MNHPPFYYLSEVETNVVQCSLEPFTWELFANQFLCNTFQFQFKASLCCTMHCENLLMHTSVLIYAVQEHPPHPPTPHLHCALAKISSMCCFIMHLVLNIARQFVERKILHRFAVRRCSTYYYTPLLPRTKPFLSKPSHMWRSSMQKRAVATNP